MELQRISSQVSIKHCSLCPGTTEFYCHDCKADLCRPCKEMHVDILDIKYHKVTVYSGKITCKSFHEPEMCPEHWDQVIEMYCENCDLPVCFHCSKHRQHKQQNIGASYERKLLQSNNSFINISCQNLYNAQVLLTELKSDFTTYHKEMRQFKTAMLTMSKSLKDFMDNVQGELKLKCKFILVCRLGKQKMKLKRNIAKNLKYEHRYEKSVNKPVQFLRFIKTVHLPQIQDTPRLSQHCLLSLTQKINMGDMLKLLSEIKITESGKQRRAENKLPPTLMASPLLLKSVKETGISDYYHITSVESDRIWVSEYVKLLYCDKLILIDTAKGETIESVEDVLESHSGNHTINSDRELIYIDNHFNIRKLSDDMKTTTLLIDNPGFSWVPRCLYSSPSSGDLLVGMCRLDSRNLITCRYDTHSGKIMRYNNTGRHTQTIPANNANNMLYRDPHYITENNNGDVVVSSNYHAVVVTSREGVHRFSYKGPPSGSGLCSGAVCTDALFHILVCDLESNTIHMLSKDGEFLKYLLTKEPYGMISLSFDHYTHCLWVESAARRTWMASKLSVYGHISRHPIMLGNNIPLCV
ncbi:uncharacterized protein LOC144624798 [Crassostrea virginica]